MSPRTCAHCHRAVTIHARGLCSLCYLRHRDEYPRTKHHRPFTTKEREIIRRDWGKRKAAAIAATLGRHVRDIYAAAVRFGATVPRKMLRTSPEIRKQLEQLHDRGLSDREIGQVVGHSHGTVARWLRRLGRPSNCRTKNTDPYPARTREKIRRHVLRRIKSEGLETAVPFLRKHAEGRAQAVRMGWPQARTLLEARILDALSMTPGTTPKQLHAGPIGDRAGAHLRATLVELRRRGLIVVVGFSQRSRRYALATGVTKEAPHSRRAS